VWLDAFYIDKTEVTNAQFKAFCDVTGYLPPANPDWDPNYFHSKHDYPVLQVTYDQAAAYCAWRHKRLPTEAEWEKAARGTEGRKYPWGNDWDPKRVNGWGEPYRYTAPVGSVPEGASPYGAVDMAGNVWEWCYDWFDPNYYAHSPARNPRGPATPTPWRAARGGGWSSTQMSGDFEVANRSKNGPTETRYHLGCRCAWSATWSAEK
jgi:formylglycine-generating enzyme required for sulfatase activity